MTIAAIILTHYKERRDNLKRIITDLQMGTVVPDRIYVWNDGDFEVHDPRAICINTSSYLPVSRRFALGMLTGCDYCFFLDDDLTVSRETLQNFSEYAELRPDAILGVEGNINALDEKPYTKGTTVGRGDILVPVSVIIRTYFCPTKALPYLYLMRLKNSFPEQAIDDVALCLGYRYEGKGECWVIPISESTDVREIDDGGVGQCREAGHYENRDYVCKYLRDKYANIT